MDYSIEPIDISNEGLRKVANLLQECFPEATKFTEAFLKWQYVDNPCGKVHGFNAVINGEIAAHYATIPVEYTISGRNRKGLLSLNTATSVNHRGKKLFKTLAEKTFETAKMAGYDFVVGVANANSTHGFVNKMDFQLIAPLVVKVGLGMVKGDSNAAELMAVKSDNWLNWRLSNPEHRYTVGTTGIYSETIKLGLRAVLSTCKTSTEKAIWGFKLWIGLTPNLHTSALVFNFPDKLKPSPLNLIFRDLAGNIGAIDPEKVHFDLLDFDAY